MFIFFFPIIVLITLLALHLYLYLSVVSFFPITSEHLQNMLMGILIFLALSFLLSVLLTRWKDNIITRAYFLGLGVWIGTLAQLLVAVSLVWLLQGIFLVSNPLISTSHMAMALIGIALIYSIYGIWNAFRVKKKYITISIPNLPRSWKGKKLVQLSDLHLGSTKSLKFAEKVVEMVNQEKPKAVVITGDLFDGADGMLKKQEKPFTDLHTESGIFLVTGNHETYLGLEEVNQLLEGTPIRRIRDEVIDVDGLKLIGINYPRIQEKSNILRKLKKLRPEYEGKPNILLYHAPGHIKSISKMGINLELAGHTHGGQILLMSVVTFLFYRGFNYGLFKIGDFQLYISSGTGFWGPPMRTGSHSEIVVITLE
jgi:uncharacterized protein